MPYYRSSRYRRSSDSSRALRHIEEAKKLSILLGGNDQIVKDYFFSMSGQDLEKIFIQYGEIYGEEPEEYARETFHKWKSGKTIMSGMVAERFFNLLPPMMPFSIKIQIAESLWRHLGPSSHKILKIGPSATTVIIQDTVTAYLQEVVQNFYLSQSFKKRFEWLSGNDVQIEHQLLNHLQDLEKNLVVEAVLLQSERMLIHLNDDRSNFTQLYRHTVSVNKHKLELVTDKNVNGCSLEDYVPKTTSFARAKDDNFNWGCLVWVLIIGGIIILARL